MSKQPPPTRGAIKAIFIAMLAGAAIIAVMAMILPGYVGLDDDTALIMRVVFLAAAAISAGQAFWLKARLTKHLPPEERPEQRRTSTIQRR